MFGTENTAAEIAPKVLVDMFVYNPVGNTRTISLWLLQPFIPSAISASKQQPLASTASEMSLRFNGVADTCSACFPLPPCRSFVVCEVWATPSLLMAYFWKDSNFDWRATYSKWRSREYWLFLLPSSLLSVWLVWLPAVSIIYALPSSLQIPLFCIVSCFWSILLQLIAKANTATHHDSAHHQQQQQQGEQQTADDQLAALDDGETGGDEQEDEQDGEEEERDTHSDEDDDHSDEHIEHDERPAPLSLSDR